MALQPLRRFRVLCVSFASFALKRFFLPGLRPGFCFPKEENR